jgi:hypothetical protein
MPFIFTLGFSEKNLWFLFLPSSSGHPLERNLSFFQGSEAQAGADPSPRKKDIVERMKC